MVKVAQTDYDSDDERDPLCAACAAGDAAVVAQLIAARADVDAVGSQGETPLATADGSVFELLNIVPYLKKFRRHPVTGAPLAASDLIKLQFHKNGDGKYHCPVTFKVFNQHTHIVAVRQTGNVYAYDAVRELNIKAKCMRDLLDDTPFARADVITIQDPSDGSAREIERFSHVKEDLSAAAVRKDDNVRHSDATSRVMSQLTKGAASSSSAAASSMSSTPQNAETAPHVSRPCSSKRAPPRAEPAIDAAPARRAPKAAAAAARAASSRSPRSPPSPRSSRRSAAHIAGPPNEKPITTSGARA